MPELVEQPMLGRHQPGQQRRAQRRALPSLGETLLEGDEMIVLFRQRQGTVQAPHTTTEGGAAGIAKAGPDFVQGHGEFIVRRVLSSTHQPPAQLLRVGAGQVAQHPITRLVGSAQAFGAVEVAHQATAPLADIEEDLQIVLGQAFKAGVAAGETDRPDAPQRIGPALARYVSHVERGLAGGDARVRSGQFAMPVIHRRHGGTGQRQACHEPSSRNRHCLTCVQPWSGLYPS